MKKLITYFCILLVIIPLSISAQKVTSYYELPGFPGIIDAKTRFAPLSLKLKDDGLQLALVKQYAEGSMEQHASYFFVSGQHLINFIHIFQWDKNLKEIKHITDSCSRDTVLNRGTGIGPIYLVKYKRPYKVNRKYPYIFDLPAKSDTIKWDFNGDTYNPWIYDTSLNRYGLFDRGYVLKKDPPSNGNTYSLHTDNGVVYDTQNQNATVIWARKPKEGDDNQFRLKNLSFVTYSYKSSDVSNKNFLSKNSTIINSFDVDFEFCRLLNVGVPVYANDKNGSIVGKAFLFSRPTLLTKKGQDPNKNNFEVVYCNSEGKLILHRTITLQSEKRGMLQLLYAFGNTNSLSLFVEYNTNSEGFGFLHLNTDTLYQQVLTPISTLNKNIVQTPDDPDAQCFMKREQIFGPFSIRKGISADAQGRNNQFAGHQVLPDGSIIIYGQRKGVMSEMTPSSASSMNTPEVTYSVYAEFFALHFDSNYQLIKQYITDMTINKDPATFFSNVAKDKLIVVSSMHKKPASSADISGLSLESQINSGIKYEYPIKYYNVPKVICIDFTNKTIQNYMPTNDFYILNPDMYHLFAPDGSLFLAGFIQIKNNRTLRIEKVEF
jgi:hypothetical protein